MNKKILQENLSEHNLLQMVIKIVQEIRISYPTGLSVELSLWQLKNTVKTEWRLDFAGLHFMLEIHLL